MIGLFSNADVEVSVSTGWSGRPRSWQADAVSLGASFRLSDAFAVMAQGSYAVGSDRHVVRGGLGPASFALDVRPLLTNRIQLSLQPQLTLVGPSLTVTLPVLLDVALGDAGAGLQVELGRGLTTGGSSGAWADGSWGAGVTVAAPLGDVSTVMLGYSQQADAGLALGEGWIQAGYARALGADAVTLLCSLGRSTAGNSAASLGVSVGF